MKKRILLNTLSLLFTSLGIAWYVRANTWVCGRFDFTSGCASSVKLQIDKLSLERDSIDINYRSFDLSSGAKFALVGLKGVRSQKDVNGQINKRHYAVLALFNTQDGSLIRVLRELKGELLSVSEDGSVNTFEVALSRDGSLVASYAIGENENSLIVQRTNDSSLVKTIYDLHGKNGNYVYHCTTMLDFSPDNKALQCGSTLTLLDSNKQKSLSVNGEYVFPFFADFSAGSHATAPDGASIDYKELSIPGSKLKVIESPLDLFDSMEQMVFSPDGKHFIQAQVAYHEARGERFFTPPPFRRLSGVAIWNRNGQLKRTFFTNNRYREIAWSRDSKYFALINKDLSLQIFQVP